MAVRIGPCIVFHHGRRTNRILTPALAGQPFLSRWDTDGFLKNAEAHRPRELEEFSSDLEHLRSISDQ